MIRLKRVIFVTGLLTISVLSHASIGASATIQKIGASGGVNDYSILLDNIGTTPIETFWFSWVPGQDYMGVKPQTFSQPSNFNAPAVTNGGPTDGFAIRWESSTGLASGKTGVFTFWSTLTPAQIAGDSPFHPGVPVETSFVYAGIFPSGGSEKFVVQSVPTPPSAIVLGVGLIGLMIRRKRAK